MRGVTVSLESKTATVTLAVPSLMDALTQLPGLVDTVKNLGFEAEPSIPV